MRVIVVGLGSGDMSMLPKKNLDILLGGKPLYLRTAHHPIVKELEDRGLQYAAFDHFYENEESFRDVYQRIAECILQEARNTKEEIVYAVPGHPMVAEMSVKLLIDQLSAEEIHIIPAPSALEAIYAVLRIDPSDGLMILDATKFDPVSAQAGLPMLITQIHSRLVASEVKLSLMEFLDDEHEVILVKGAGIEGVEKIVKIPLYQLDRLLWIDHLTSLYVPNNKGNSVSCRYPMDPIVDVMQKLRSEEGCPWDREQTHETLKKYLIEEAYETLEAIDQADDEKIMEELGDLLLQVVFHAQIACERGAFDVNDITETIKEKMIRRHPHVFAKASIENAQEVLVNWEKIKKREKMNRQEGFLSILSEVPLHFPALMRAEKVQKKASQVGFDWPDIQGALEKMPEEFQELIEAIDRNKTSQIYEELGDLLFSIVNVSRLLAVDPEEALQCATKKFAKRFQVMEKWFEEKSIDWKKLTISQMDQFWQEAKKTAK